MTEVACVGIAVLDRIFQVDEHIGLAGKYRASARLVVGGGVAANAAVTVARLGGHARFLGVIGDDDTGAAILRGLDEEDVATGGVRTVTGGQSPESVIQVDRDGDRLIINHASPDLFDRAEPPGATDLEGCDAILADMRWPTGAIGSLRAASRMGVPGIVDCDHDPADSPGILEAASHIVFAADTLRLWTGLDELAPALAEAHRRTGAWVAATEGERGTTWLEDGEPIHQSAFRVEVVDTLGAGDVFHGAFALALAQGRDIAGSVRWASAAAAIKCQRFGGRAGIPTRRELEMFLEER